MEPIAIYSEVRFEGSRTFTLFPDKVIVRGKRSLQSEFETTMSLAMLDPNPDKLHFRNKSFTHGMLAATVSFVACTVLVSGFHMPLTTTPPTLLGVMGIAGVLLMVATWTKIEFARFKNKDGIVVLDIARAGKDASKFDSFIVALSKQIKLASNIPNMT
jgi:hypothetical protein